MFETSYNEMPNKPMGSRGFDNQLLLTTNVFMGKSVDLKRQSEINDYYQ